MSSLNQLWKIHTSIDKKYNMKINESNEFKEKDCKKEFRKLVYFDFKYASVYKKNLID